MSGPLYTSEILRLALETATFQRLADPDGSVEKRSPVCGSRVIVDVALGTDGRVSAVGLEARACALGQASSALLAAHAVGRTPDELEAARAALTGWLSGARPDPGDWPGLDHFTPAREKSARHASIRLAFEAAAEAARMAAH